MRRKKDKPNPAVASIRKAIGARPGERVVLMTPPLDRPPSWPAVADAPAGFTEFSRLFWMTEAELRALGLRNWDGGLMLFPVEWFDHIPEGFPVETVNGKVKAFRRRQFIRERRMGMLPYGVRIGPPKDEEHDG